jgi:OOP family OmpA-OmpF porin
MKYTIIAAAVVAALAAGDVYAQPYVTADGQPVRSGAGQCWRTSSWNEQTASEECDPQLFAKKPPMPAAIRYRVDVLFAFEDDRLSADARKELDELAQKLIAMDLEKVVAVGHSDRLGTAQHNQLLSARRTWAVRDYLAAKGVAEEQLILEARGERDPVTPGACDVLVMEGRADPKLIACLQPDRRVRVELIGRQKGSD